MSSYYDSDFSSDSDSESKRHDWSEPNYRYAQMQELNRIREQRRLEREREQEVTATVNQILTAADLHKTNEQIKNDNNSCMNAEDPIYLTPIQVPIMIDNKCYERQSLLDWITRTNRVPHSRRYIDMNEFKILDQRGGKKSKKTKMRKSKNIKKKRSYSRRRSQKK